MRPGPRDPQRVKFSQALRRHPYSLVPANPMRRKTWVAGEWTINNIATAVAKGGLSTKITVPAQGVRGAVGGCRKRCCKPGVFINGIGTVSSTARDSPCLRSLGSLLIRDRLYELVP
jgi:hypothetical protein